MSQTRLFALIAALFLFAGCASQPLPDPEPTDPSYDDGTGGATTGGMDDDRWGGGENVPWDSGDELSNLIYFAFDSSDIAAEYADIVRRHAMQLAENPNARVRLEGHADERGSREYNIGLGERRAQSVRRALLLQGASAGQILTVSFGEERPAAEGSSESDYALNRRVEVVYTN